MQKRKKIFIPTYHFYLILDICDLKSIEKSIKKILAKNCFFHYLLHRHPVVAPQSFIISRHLLLLSYYS